MYQHVAVATTSMVGVVTVGEGRVNVYHGTGQAWLPRVNVVVYNSSIYFTLQDPY